MTPVFRCAVACLCGVLLLSSAAARAQVYPVKPMRFIVPFPAGGFSDVLSRLIAQKLTEQLGQPVIMDNRPGASGNIGAEAVARAAPDGYTLLSTSTNFVTNPGLFKKLPFDPVRDFTPITLISDNALLVAVHPSMSVRSVKELIALARARPGEINFASSGPGTTPHLIGELINLQTRTTTVHVPHKGGGAQMTAILSGEVAVAFPYITPALPHIRSGRIRALAVTTAKRASTLPNLPTMAESGLPGFDVSGWLGLSGPAKLPPEIVNLLQTKIAQSLREPTVREQFRSQGADPVGSSPEAFASFIPAQIDKWTGVIRQSGIAAQ
jgi:tripartite-type tricarboxylate transporter receptor subunit TctC